MKATLSILPILLIGVIILTLITPNARLICTPMVMGIVIVSWMFFYLKELDGKVPMFDAGMFCALLTLLYTIYPLINYLFGGYSFGILGDSRLTTYEPTPVEIGHFHYRHVLYLFFLVAFYIVFRKKSITPEQPMPEPSKNVQRYIIGGYVSFLVFFLFLKVTTGMDFNAGYDRDSTDSQLNVTASLPLPVVQLAGRLAGLLFIFKISLLTIFMLKSRKNKKWRAVLIVWILFEVIMSIAARGSRDALMFFLLSTILLYAHLYKTPSFKMLLLSFGGIFVFFMFMGFYRTIDDVSDWGAVFDSVDVIMSATNEFQALLGTAFDVYQIKLSGTAIPWYIYINDIIPLLPPAQFIPFEKIEASEWYLRQIGISGTGQGYMWGVISQSVVGLDWIELALRGALLGWILASFHNWFQQKNRNFVILVFYVCLCLGVYNTYRNTTFAIFYPMFWEFLPFYLGLKICTSYRIRRPHQEEGI